MAGERADVISEPDETYDVVVKEGDLGILDVLGCNTQSQNDRKKLIS